MSDVLARFHRTLVEEIRAQRPDYLRAPFTVAEIYQNLVPYGTHRDRLGVEMNGDYEDALLRLLAGEGGFLILESEAALRELREELESPNPNTGLYREFAAADVRLDLGRLDLESGSRATYAGPDTDESGVPVLETVPVGDLAPADLEPEPTAESDDDQGRMAFDYAEADRAEPGSDDQGVTPACRWCRAELPQRANLNFCPFCGTDVNVVPCPACSEELEPEWRFCVSCGTEVAE